MGYILRGEVKHDHGYVENVYLTKDNGRWHATSDKLRSPVFKTKKEAAEARAAWQEQCKRTDEERKQKAVLGLYEPPTRPTFSIESVGGEA